MENENTKGSGLLLAGLVVFGIILLDVLFTSFHTVGVGQVGIVTRFGHIARSQQSGFLVKAPWPIEHLSKMNIKTQIDKQEASAASKDLQTVDTTIAVNYHLTPADARRVYQTVGTNYSDTVIQPIIQEAVKSTTADYTAEQLISQRPEVENALEKRLVSKLTSRGVTVDNVSIVNFNFSATFDASIEAKQAAQQNAQKAQYELQTATTQAQANATQQAALTPEILQQQAIAKWNGVLPTTVAGDNGTVFNVPLR